MLWSIPPQMALQAFAKPLDLRLTPCPSSAGGKARESCSKVVAHLPKGSYHGDVPWLRSPPPCPAFTRAGGLGAKAAPCSYAGDGAKSFPRWVKCLGGAAASLPLAGDPLLCSSQAPPSPRSTPAALFHVVTDSREVHARWMGLPQPPRSHVFPIPYEVWGCSGRGRMPKGS